MDILNIPYKIIQIDQSTKTNRREPRMSFWFICNYLTLFFFCSHYYYYYYYY